MSGVGLLPVPGADGLRAAFACYPSGVAALAALVDGRPVGMAASSFTSVSLDPPLVSVCIGRSSETWPQLAYAPELGISVLAEGQAAAARELSRRGVDRFAQVRWAASAGGAVFVHDSPLWLSCQVHDQVRAGDHDIVLLQVGALRADPDVAPIVFHGSGFRQLLPPPPP